MTEEEIQTRFSGVLGDDYGLFEKSIPHHDKLQNLVGKYISSFCNKSTFAGEFIFIEGGSGTGITTIKILTASPKIKIIAVDNEKRTLDQARVILSDFADRITFSENDLFAELQAQPDESIDGFVSAYTIHNFPSNYREKLFSELYRILKPGGLLINADKYALDDEISHKKTLDEQIKRFDVYDDIGRSDVKLEWTRHYLEDEEIKFTEAEQFSIFSELNFKNAEIVFREGMDAIFVAYK